MRTLHALTFSLALLLALCGAADAVDTSAVRFCDSGGFILDGANSATTAGAAMLSVDAHLYVRAKNYAGPRAGRIDWVDATVTAYNRITCTALTPTFIGIQPYTESDDLHFCGGGGLNCTNWAGTYRVLGDGNRAANECGGAGRQGVALYDSAGHYWVLVIKTVNNHFGAVGSCGGGGLTDGPGAVGQWLLLELPVNV